MFFVDVTTAFLIMHTLTGLYNTSQMVFSECEYLQGSEQGHISQGKDHLKKLLSYISGVFLKNILTKGGYTLVLAKHLALFKQYYHSDWCRVKDHACKDKVDEFAVRTVVHLCSVTCAGNMPVPHTMYSIYSLKCAVKVQ